MDNGSNDADKTNGRILLENVPCGEYTITETVAPGDYVRTTDSQTKTVTNGETATFSFVNTIEHDCVGLTPGYWKNWRNHYTPEQFSELLKGTIANGNINAAIDAADGIFHPKMSDFKGLLKLKSHLLATQLTLNLGTLTEDCQVQWNSETWTVGLAVEEALDILRNPAAYTSDYIVKMREILEMISNLGG